MRQQPVHFRKEEVQYITQRWHSAESCALVGVGSVGKSNLLHHLLDPRVHDEYLPNLKGRFKAVMIDPNLLGPTSSDDIEQFRCWSGYELLMHRLYMAFYPFDILGEDAKDFYNMYQNLQDGTNPLYAYMGLRYFELGLEYFLRRGIHIVFLFDEFEEMLRQMPVKFFQTLRGLRDNHKTQLSYLTFSREPLHVLVQKMDLSDLEYEPFVELFTDHTYYVGPYNRDDAAAMIARLVTRNPDVNYSQSALDFLLYASGRYAGIMRAGFKALEMIVPIERGEVKSRALVEQLARRQQVRIECETIWKSLTNVEQTVLLNVVRSKDEVPDLETEQAIQMLVQKRLVKVLREQQQLQIQPPVFDVYVHSLA